MCLGFKRTITESVNYMNITLYSIFNQCERQAIFVLVLDIFPFMFKLMQK